MQIQTASATAAASVGLIYGPFAAAPGVQPDIIVTLREVVELPPMPAGSPVAAEEGRVAFFFAGQRLTAHFHGWGQVCADLTAQHIEAVVTEGCLQTYSVLEDLLLTGLGPLLRRRQMFAVHAFAASRQGRALLIIGDIGAGKTTTGLSLLHAGWSLLANDSPFLLETPAGLQIAAFPGLLSAFDDSLAHFPELAPILADSAGRRGHSRQKRAFPAEQVYPGVWTQSAVPAALCFPAITPGLTESALMPISAQEALLALIPQSIEGWDRAFIAPHLAMLGRLAETTPAFRLHLAPVSSQLPQLLATLIPASSADCPAHDDPAV